MKNPKKSANAEKQRRFREKQKALGKKLIRGYVTPAAMENYKELAEKTGWTDSDMLSNSLRITYAAYKNGQIRLLNQWLKEQDLKKKKQAASTSQKPSPTNTDNTELDPAEAGNEKDKAQ